MIVIKQDGPLEVPYPALEVPYPATPGSTVDIRRSSPGSTVSSPASYRYTFEVGAPNNTKQACAPTDIPSRHVLLYQAGMCSYTKPGPEPDSIARMIPHVSDTAMKVAPAMPKKQMTTFKIFSDLDSRGPYILR